MAGFTKWVEIPGRGRTISTPAPILHTGLLKLFVRGTDNRIYESDFDGANWSEEWVEVRGGGLTLARPSSVVEFFGSEGRSILKLFVTGTDDRIYVNDFDAQRPVDPVLGRWSGWSRVVGGDFTPSSPAPVTFFLNFVNLSSTILFLRAEDDRVLFCK
jgi:hypothetical protein